MLSKGRGHRAGTHPPPRLPAVQARRGTNLAVARSPDGVNVRTARGGVLHVLGLESRTPGDAPLAPERVRLGPAGVQHPQLQSPEPRWEGRIPGAESEITAVYLRSQPSSLIKYSAWPWFIASVRGRRELFMVPLTGCDISRGYYRG